MVEQYPGNSEEFEGGEKTPANNTVQLNSSSAVLFNGGSSRPVGRCVVVAVVVLSRLASLRCAVATSLPWRLVLVFNIH